VKDKSDNWYISESTIHGFGVFAKGNKVCGEIIDVVVTVPVNTYLPLSCQAMIEFLQSSQITSMGNMLNHLTCANCELVENQNSGVWVLKTTSSIKDKEELAVDYKKNPWFLSRDTCSYCEPTLNDLGVINEFK